ncbi:hypothetical protein HHK36_016201 [Tetracentron sinense]|uniref:non-specific serine/threonine protein kinase n=1 Tax=Tetracentron sinense TaxID=13715 RepID=A0A835DB99_TETSI|nr:hypothetical protein HHK36_016201 [Tetracentron sinense]
MTITNSLFTVTIILIAVISPSVVVVVVDGLGSGSTIAVSYGSGTVCGIIAGEPLQRIECYRGGEKISIGPNTSYESISGGRNFFCGLTSGGASLLCWDTVFSNSSFRPQRIYYSDTVRLRDLTVGDDHVCAVEILTGVAKCWRGDRDRSPFPFPSPEIVEEFQSITSGVGFSCGVLRNSSRVQCWGFNTTGEDIQRQFGNISMSSLVAGDSHACGLNRTGFLVCKGRNDSGQLDVPSGSAFEFSDLALGANHSCAIRRLNGSAVCWGGDFSGSEMRGISFESIVAGMSFSCGLTTRNLSLFCWGIGWSVSGTDLPLSKIVPGPCTPTSCRCGIYPNSETLCSGTGNICNPCEIQTQLPSPIPLTPPLPLSPPSSSRGINRGLLAFAIIGSVGICAGVCTILYCILTGICCCRHKKIFNSVQPSITGANANSGTAAIFGPYGSSLRSSTIRRQSSRAMSRQRSGTSSKHADRAEEFSLSELAEATNNFSWANKIGAGSFGTVYRGKLTDGREVAIKRGETDPITKKCQEKESAFESELAFLSRLHHKHLVSLVGFCEERDERLLVYEYMKNGSIYDHLHDKSNVNKSSSVLNSWKMRIKVALDAARGIEYLHIYAVPSIIHRDIKSSNILLDANLTARVSDFGLSLMEPEPDDIPVKAAGTAGYIDPEYYVLNVLTAKSDVYGLGVVLLELLTGKRAIFKDEDGGGLTSVVDFAVPMILAGELGRVLDGRVGPPEMKEAEAVELVAYTAMHCVNLEGKDRPRMTDIVTYLESAFALCDDSHGCISSATFSTASQ